jgi:hypothetical protein
MPIKKISCRDKEKIYQLYQAGITAEALSADYGVTVSTIKNYIRYFRRKERNEQWLNEQRERQAEQNRTIGTPETSLISTAEYLYSLVQRLPDNVTVEVLKDSSRIAVSITGAGEDIILANSKGGFCEAGKAD